MSAVTFASVTEREFWAQVYFREIEICGTTRAGEAADVALEQLRARNVGILERGTRPTSRDEIANAIVVTLAGVDVAVSTELATKVAEAIFVVFRQDRVSA